MQQALPWITALGVLVVIAAGLAFWATRPRQSAGLPLPNEWAIAPRAIFSVDERRAYRHLRDAFPNHVVLAKLPLIRLCQPIDPKEIRYWFELLGSIHVSYAICTPQGRVLAAVDLDGERAASRRTQQIKQGVLSTCRIRHLRCTLEHMPSAQELQRLLPSADAAIGFGEPAAPISAAAQRDTGQLNREAAEPLPSMPTTLTRNDLELGPAPKPGFLPPASVAGPSSAQRPKTGQPVKTGREEAMQPPRHSFEDSNLVPAPAVDVDRAASKTADAKGRKERKPLWQDSGLFQDSFFGIENLRDAGPPSSFGSLLAESARGRSATPEPQISADPSQGMLESERAKLKQQGKR